MTQLSNLRVFTQARANIRALSKLCDQACTFGDLKDQAKRTAVSVVSNIAEGEQVKLHRNFRRVLEDSSARGARGVPRSEARSSRSR